MVKESNTKHKSRFRLITDPSVLEGYCVSRAGVVLGIRGRPLKVVLKDGRKAPFVSLVGAAGRTTRRTPSLFTLVRDYWGRDAAASFERLREPRIVKELQKDG